MNEFERAEFLGSVEAINRISEQENEIKRLRQQLYKSESEAEKWQLVAQTFMEIIASKK